MDPDGARRIGGGDDGTEEQRQQNRQSPHQQEVNQHDATDDDGRGGGDDQNQHDRNTIEETAGSSKTISASGGGGIDRRRHIFWGSILLAVAIIVAVAVVVAVVLSGGGDGTSSNGDSVKQPPDNGDSPPAVETTTSTPETVAAPVTSPLVNEDEEVPTASPVGVLSPINEGGVAPTTTPSTEQPTEQRERVISLITYGIALENGVENLSDSLWTAEYLSNLIAALGILSNKVAEEGQQQSLRVRRSLAATVIQPTGFETVNDIPCPTDKVISFDDSSLCQEVTAKVRLAVTSEEDQLQFETDLQQAIVSGELQEELDTLMWEIAGENPVTVLASLEDAGQNVTFWKGPVGEPPKEP